MSDIDATLIGFDHGIPGEGAEVEGFALGAVLGRGAQGVVYQAARAEDPALYAAKVVPLRSLSPAMLGRLRRECTLTSRLRHPGIVTVHKVVERPDCLVIVMDQAVGRPASRLCDGTLGWELSLRIAAAAARALDFIYRRNGVIHRDIKPANLIIDLAGGLLRGLKVVDFGLGRRQAGGDASLTMAGDVLGTPLYMSPEQAEGSARLTFATDLYALGAVLFHLVAGRPPFNRGGPVEILVQHRTAAPPVLGEVVPACPRPLSDLVARCLAKTPSARFPSYAAFLAAADALLSGNPFDQSEAPGHGSSGARPAVVTTRSGWRRPGEAAAPPGQAVPTTRSRWRPPGEGAAPPAPGTGRSAWKRPGEAAPAEPAPPKTTARWLHQAIAPPPAPPAPAPVAVPALEPATEATDPSTDDSMRTMGPSPDTRPAEPSLAAGTTVGDYFTVLRPLGAGAMGEVYEVEDRFIERRLAMKIMSEADMRRPGAVARFRCEATALANVGHEAFPYLAGGGSHQGRDYLFMELVQGVDLRTWLAQRGGRVPERTALAIVLQLAQAMEAAYRVCGMVHRDLKPANLMVAEAHDGSPQIRIIDFGVSVYIDYGDWDDYSDRAYGYVDDGNEGRVVGTPAYMAPEQALAQPATPFMDMYAMGAILHHLVTGSPPFTAASGPALLMRLLHDPPPTLDDFPGAGQGTRYLVKRLLAKDPKQRFPSYRKLVAATEAALRGRTVD